MSASYSAISELFSRRYFFYYVCWQFVLSVYVCLFSCLHLGLLSRDKGSFKDALQHTPPSVIVIFISFAAMCAVYVLLRYHLRLVSSNITTNEDFKTSDSPFDLGRRENIIRTLCGARRPTRLLAREWLRDGIHPSNRTLFNAPQLKATTAQPQPPVTIIDIKLEHQTTQNAIDQTTEIVETTDDTRIAIHDDLTPAHTPPAVDVELDTLEYDDHTHVTVLDNAIQSNVRGGEDEEDHDDDDDDDDKDFSHKKDAIVVVSLDI